MKLRSNDPANRRSSIQVRTASRRRGTSLIQVLGVTAVFALLSAILFPRIATPTRMARMQVYEAASGLGVVAILRESKLNAEAAMGHPAQARRDSTVNKQTEDANRDLAPA